MAGRTDHLRLTDRLLGRLAPFAADNWRLALSGGRDSMVLLHALAALRTDSGAVLGAVHIDHGLHPESVRWADHCVAECERLGVSCEVIRVDASPGPGQSPEEAAREARYRALAEQVGPGGLLLTAHHQGDQAETLLLQLLRGGGPRGLAAMPETMPFGAGWLVRPLLGEARRTVAAYASQWGLSWIEDPSNTDSRFDRNYLRNVVVPELTERWPSVEATLARSAEHMAEASRLLDQLAEADLATAGSYELDGTLGVEVLADLAPERQRNLLRFWLRFLGAPLPDAGRLERIRTEVAAARADAEPRVRWGGVEVRRFAGRLHLLPKAPPTEPFDLGWRPEDGPLPLPAGVGVLRTAPATGAGLRAQLSAESFRVRTRRGGERCRPAGAVGSRPLKKILQEKGIPPWERNMLPLLYLDEELVAVPGVLVCEGYAATPGEPGLEVRLTRSAIASNP